MAGYVVSSLRPFDGHLVHVRLRDGTEFTGLLRIELLSEQSLSVYIASHGGEGVTLYIDQIADIVPIDQTTP
jgi:hypothetical protein